jgi:hypothetical protein
MNDLTEESPRVSLWVWRCLLIVLGASGSLLLTVLVLYHNVDTDPAVDVRVKNQQTSSLQARLDDHPLQSVGAEPGLIDARIRGPHVLALDGVGVQGLSVEFQFAADRWGADYDLTVGPSLARPRHLLP